MAVAPVSKVKQKTQIFYFLKRSSNLTQLNLILNRDFLFDLIIIIGTNISPLSSALYGREVTIYINLNFIYSINEQQTGIILLCSLDIGVHRVLTLLFCSFREVYQRGVGHCGHLWSYIQPP